MTPSRWDAVILGLAALGCAVLLVWTSGAGPVSVIGEQHRTVQETETDDGRDPAPDDEGDTETRTEEPVDEGVREDPVPWLADLVALVVALGGLLVGGLLLALLVAQLAGRRAEAPPSGPAPPYDLDSVREEIARAAETQAEALAEGEVRDGIIACWVRLEEAVGRAGVPRSPADTPTEFVVRLLHALDVDPRAVAALAGLYHEARFSSHRMPEDSRARARRALDDIHRDLRVRVG